MFFEKKKRKNLECENCNSEIDKSFSFCPYCGKALFDKEKELKDFGMLGKMDEESISMEKSPMPGLGISDKFIGSLVNNLMKSLGNQLSKQDKTEIKNFPNGIKIKIGTPHMIKKQPKAKPYVDKKKTITDKQIEKMSKLPRASAKTTVKRLSDKIVYELTTPGINTTDDVFISKLESGYEVKAIGNKKVYVNTIPINLPLKDLSLLKNKLFLEFHPQQNLE